MQRQFAWFFRSFSAERSDEGTRPGFRSGLDGAIDFQPIYHGRQHRIVAGLRSTVWVAVCRGRIPENATSPGQTIGRCVGRMIVIGRMIFSRVMGEKLSAAAIRSAFVDGATLSRIILPQNDSAKTPRIFRPLSAVGSRTHARPPNGLKTRRPKEIGNALSDLLHSIRQHDASDCAGQNRNDCFHGNLGQSAQVKLESAMNQSACINPRDRSLEPR